MDKRRRWTIGTAVGLLTLFAGGAAALADSLDAGLAGAWTASQPDCAKLFVRRGGALAGPAGRQIRPGRDHRAPGHSPARHQLPRREGRPRERSKIKITADYNNSISYTTPTVEIKVKSTGEIVYSPTGDPALDTTLIKCPI